MEKYNLKYGVMKNLGALFAFFFLLTALLWSVVTNII
jgi:hypothetical protein